MFKYMVGISALQNLQFNPERIILVIVSHLAKCKNFGKNRRPLLILCSFFDYRFYPDEKQNSTKTMYQTPKSGGLLANRAGYMTPAKSKVFQEDHEPWSKQILDPGSDLVLKWNRVFLVSCLLALFIDPLYFFLPSIHVGNDTICIKMDRSLSITVTFFRSLADLFYVFHMVIKFRTAYVAPSSRVFGRGELVMDPKKIARKYLRSDFFLDLAAALPLPQVCLFCLHEYFLYLVVKHLINISAISETESLLIVAKSQATDI